MERKILIALLLPLWVLIMPGITLSARTKPVIQKFPVSDNLRQIANHTPFMVKYHLGAPKVEVRYFGKEIVTDRITVSENNRCLRIMFSSDSNPVVIEDLMIDVWSEDVGTLSNFGTGSFSADKMASVSVTLQNFGTGDIVVNDIDCTTLQLDLYGVGMVKVTHADTCTLKALLQGAGNINVMDLDSNSVDLILQGAGNIDIMNMDATTVQALNQGVGNITLKGDVTSAKYTNQGTGDINARAVQAVRTTKINTGLGSIKD